MNIIYFDFVALVLILIMFILNWVQGLTKGRTNHLFMIMTIAAFFSSLGDYLAGYGSNYFEPSEFHRILILIFNYVYFFAHNNVIYIFFLYCFSSMGMWHKVMRNKILKWYIIISCVLNNLAIFLNIFTEKFFTVNEKMEYVRGDFIIVFYVFAFIMMVLGTVIIVKYKKSVPLDKFLVLGLMVPLNVMAIIVQMINGSILIETYALAVEIAIMVLVIQRQDEAVDPITGAKKINLAMSELKNKFGMKVPFTIVLFKIKNEKSIRVYLGQKGFNIFLHKVTDKLNVADRRAKLQSDIYYLEYGLYAFIAEYGNKDKIDALTKELEIEFEESITVGSLENTVNEMICVVNCPEEIGEYTTLMTFASSYYNSLPDTKNVHYYSDYVNDSEFIIKNEISEIIKRSFEENQFAVYYQPIYSVKDEKYVAVEALIRLKDRKYGNIAPSQFIPVAEQTGDIHAIGSYVLEEVCKFVSSNDIERYGIEQVQINLSASQCVETDLADKVFEMVDKYKIKPSLISFEISELTADIDQAMADTNISNLHRKGFKFALDDYGTGYSNVQRVTNLPISLIKLGRKFVNDLDDENMKIIVNDTIKMFKAIGMKVLVEGIEDEKKAEYFKELGCDYIQGSEYLQGYYFCKPISSVEFVEFMKIKTRENQ